MGLLSSAGEEGSRSRVNPLFYTMLLSSRQFGDKNQNLKIFLTR